MIHWASYQNKIEVMTMWYVFIPRDVGLQRFFTGTTDNPIRFRSYCKLMEEFGVENAIPIVEYYSYDDCTDAIKFILNTFPLHDDICGSDTVTDVLTQSELITVDGVIPENHITLSEIAYDYFKEVAITTGEVKKMMHQLYGLCHSYSIGTLSYLYYDSPDGKIIRRVIECICKLWDYYGDVYKQRGEIGMLGGCPEHSNKSYLWSLFDETVYLKIWIELEIKSVQFGLPLKYARDNFCS